MVVSVPWKNTDTLWADIPESSHGEVSWHIHRAQGLPHRGKATGLRMTEDPSTDGKLLPRDK